MMREPVFLLVLALISRLLKEWANESRTLAAVAVFGDAAHRWERERWWAMLADAK